MLTKGVYPYDYMNSFARFEETKLPPKEKFYSKLYDGHISDEKYEHAQKVWDAFECKNMGEYHDLYCKFFYDPHPIECKHLFMFHPSNENHLYGHSFV